MNFHCITSFYMQNSRTGFRIEPTVCLSSLYFSPNVARLREHMSTVPVPAQIQRLPEERRLLTTLHLGGHGPDRCGQGDALQAVERLVLEIVDIRINIPLRRHRTGNDCKGPA